MVEKNNTINPFEQVWKFIESISIKTDELRDEFEKNLLNTIKLLMKENIMLLLLIGLVNTSLLIEAVMLKGDYWVVKSVIFGILSVSFILITLKRRKSFQSLKEIHNATKRNK